MRVILIGIALGMGCVTSVSDLRLADMQKCDALTLWARLFQIVVAWIGAVAFLINAVV